MGLRPICSFGAAWGLRHGEIGLEEAAAGVFEDAAFEDRQAGRSGALDGAVLQIEGPAMTRANRTAVLDPAFAHGGAGVRTGVGEDGGLALIDEDREAVSVDIDGGAFSFFQVRKIAERGPGHGE